jgi:hypothetical protein
MTTVEMTAKAVQSHAQWKIRLQSAISTGKSDFDPAQVRQDNQCDFGKWLYAVPHGERDELWRTAVDLHAKFHKEAGAILATALAGDKDQAKAAMTEGSAYAQISRELSGHMMKWRVAAMKKAA